MSLLFHIGAVLAVAEGLRAHGRTASHSSASNVEVYTFEDFVQDFGRKYDAGGEDYEHRAAIFRDSLSEIRALNARAGSSWTAGVYPFMDWSEAERSERLRGLVPLASRRPAESQLLQEASAARGRLYGGSDDSFEADAPAVQNQNVFGNCGSCWAFAAVEAVEAQLMKNRSPLLPDGEPRLSVQALLDCVPKQNSCAGGCKGSHPDLAFDFMRRNGVPLETNVPYDPMHTGKCPVEPYPRDWVRVTLTGWQELPSNQAQPLMQALVESGPAVVSADSRTWYPYKSGIFDACPTDPDPNHSVLARGYGIENGKKYWLLQNSWGTQWGEAGSMRIARHDDEDSWCGTATAQDGDGCDSEHKKNVTVCGSCGFLGYSALVPKVGYVMLGPGPSGSEMERADSNSEVSASVEPPEASARVAAANEANDSRHEDVQVGPFAPAKVAESSSAEIAQPFEWSPGRRRRSFDERPAHRRRSTFDDAAQRRRRSQQLANAERGQQYVPYGETPSMEAVAVREHIDISSVSGRALLARKLTEESTANAEFPEATRAAASALPSPRVTETSLSNLLPAAEDEAETEKPNGDFFLGDYLKR